MIGEKSLTEGSIIRKLFNFSVPFLLANMLQGLYSNVDALVIGNFASTAELSAVSMGGMIMMTVNAFITGFAAAATILIGQYFGAGRADDVKKTIGSAFTLFAGIALLVTGALLLFAAPISNLMNIPDDARQGFLDYTRICYIGLIFTTGYNVTSAILRGMGDSIRPLLFIAVASAVHIALDLLLVGALGMGSAGAALSTVLSQGLSFFVGIAYLRRRDFVFDFRLPSFKPLKDKALALLRLGFPIALQDAVACASFLVLFAVINTMGVVASAAAGACDKMASVTQMPAIAFSLAISAFTAQNIGAGKPDRAVKGLKFGVLLISAIGLVLGLIMAVFPKQITSLYSDDAAVIALGPLFLLPYAAETFLVGLVFNFTGFLNGSGRTYVSMAAHLISTFLVRIPIALILGLRPGATLLDVAISVPVSSALQVILLVAYLLISRRRRNGWIADNMIKIENNT